MTVNERHMMYGRMDEAFKFWINSYYSTTKLVNNQAYTYHIFM